MEIQNEDIKSENEPEKEGSTAPAAKHKFPLFTIVIIAIVIAAGYFWINVGRKENLQPEKRMEIKQGTKGENIYSASADDPNAIKTFDITSKPFEFSLKEIEVKKGDRVRINLSNIQGFHDLVIDEFNVRTKQLQSGGSDSVEFVADKAGTFEYYCSVANHRQMGMVGKLVIE